MSMIDFFAAPKISCFAGGLSRYDGILLRILSTYVDVPSSW